MAGDVVVWMGDVVVQTGDAAVRMDDVMVRWQVTWRYGGRTRRTWQENVAVRSPAHR